MGTNPEQRWSRQKDLVPSAKLALIEPVIIGVGAVGRQVAMQLATIGVRKITLIDDDTVEEANLGAQGFLEEDLGKAKVEATASLLKRINSAIEIRIENSKYIRGMEMGNAVFCCVDKISTRQFIWEALTEEKVFSPEDHFWIDGRMSGETMRILTVANPDQAAYYPKTLFSQEEAHAGSCTAKTTYYCSNIIAGMMVSQLAKWLRKGPIEPDMQFALFGLDLTTEKEPEPPANPERPR